MALAVPVALWLAALSGWALGAIAWLATLWWAWRSTIGLGAAPLTLQHRPEHGWEVQSANGATDGLMRVRPVVVGPRLVIAQLETELSHYSLVVPADAAAPEDLRRLRQLLLSDPPPAHRADARAQSEGRGT